MNIILNILYENWIFFFILISISFIYLKLTLNRYSELREFNRTESPIEEILFQELRGRFDYRGIPYEVYSQIGVGPYRIDLVLYTKRGKIAIECDGKQYHSSINQVKHDNKKDDYLKRRGWTVFRFTGSEIYKNKKNCIDEIETYLNTKGLFKKKTAHMK